MGTFLDKNKVTGAGFLGAFGNSDSGYILLSDKTDGRVGRRVYINPKLAAKFAVLVNQDQRGEAILRRMEQLRSCAGGMQSLSNQANAFEHMDVVHHVQITYVIIQDQADTKAGVYITNLGIAEFGENNNPGLYRVRRFSEAQNWRVRGDQSTKIDTTNAAVNGRSDSLDSAATRIMPDMVKRTCRNDKETAEFNSQGYTLFYYPGNHCGLNGMSWKTPAQKRVNRKVVAAMLGQALLRATQEKRQVLWTIHGHGAEMLSDALAHLKGQDLSNHTVFLAAPDTNVTPLLRQMQEVKMELHSDVMRYQADDWSTTAIIANRTIRNNAICREIAKFNDRIDYSDTMAQMNEAAGRYSDSLSRTLAGAFLAGVALPSVTLTSVFGALAYGAGAYTLYQQAKTLRNLAGNNVNDPTLNPHMHPFKNKDQFNAHVATSHGNHINSFVALIKQKIWK